MSEELKPVRCGCGGEAKVSTWTGSNATVINDCNAVYCENCGIQTKKYNTEAEAITAWNRAMGSIEKSSTVERTAKVEKVDTNSPHSQIYKCCKCGQYTHRTAWSRDVVYCPTCGCRLIWGGDHE